MIQFAWSLVPEVKNTKWTYSDTLQPSNKTWSAHQLVSLNWLRDIRRISKLRFKQDNSGNADKPRKKYSLYIPMSSIGNQWIPGLCYGVRKQLVSTMASLELLVWFWVLLASCAWPFTEVLEKLLCIWTTLNPSFHIHKFTNVLEG